MPKMRKSTAPPSVTCLTDILVASQRPPMTAAKVQVRWPSTVPAVTIQTFYKEGKVQFRPQCHIGYLRT